MCVSTSSWRTCVHESIHGLGLLVGPEQLVGNEHHGVYKVWQRAAEGMGRHEGVQSRPAGL